MFSLWWPLAFRDVCFFSEPSGNPPQHSNFLSVLSGTSQPTQNLPKVISILFLSQSYLWCRCMCPTITNFRTTLHGLRPLLGVRKTHTLHCFTSRHKRLCKTCSFSVFHVFLIGLKLFGYFFTRKSSRKSRSRRIITGFFHFMTSLGLRYSPRLFLEGGRFIVTRQNGFFFCFLFVPNSVADFLYIGWFL